MRQVVALAVALMIVVLALGSLEYYGYETMNNQLSNTKANLNAQIAADNSQISKLQGNVSSLKSQVSQDNSTITTLKNQMALLQSQTSSLQAGCGRIIKKTTTLSANLGPCSENGLVIGANGITLNCAGNAITGTSTNTAIGIGLKGMTGVTVENCIVSGFKFGFVLNGSSGNILWGNTADSNTHVGFFLTGSSSNNLTGNTADSNGYDGFIIESGNSNNLTSNTADSSTDSHTVSGFALANCSFNILTSNTADGNNNSLDGYGVGFYLYSSATKNNYTSNTADGNGYYGYEDYSTGPMASPTYGTANFYISGNTCSGPLPPNGVECTDPFFATPPF